MQSETNTDDHPLNLDQRTYTHTLFFKVSRMVLTVSLVAMACSFKSILSCVDGTDHTGSSSNASAGHTNTDAAYGPGSNTSTNTSTIPTAATTPSASNHTRTWSSASNQTLKDEFEAFYFPDEYARLFAISFALTLLTSDVSRLMQGDGIHHYVKMIYRNTDGRVGRNLVVLWFFKIGIFITALCLPSMGELPCVCYLASLSPLPSMGPVTYRGA